LTIEKDRPIKIKDFDLTNEYAYRIVLEGTFWGVYVYRGEGSILLMKSGIRADSVDRFEAKRKNGKLEVYLHFNTDFGPRTEYIGETTNSAIFEAAEAWIAEVNKLYEERTRRQAEVAV